MAAEIEKWQTRKFAFLERQESERFRREEDLRKSRKSSLFIDHAFEAIYVPYLCRERLRKLKNDN